MADVCGPYTLEGLDQFANLDALAFSLDSPIWESADTCIFDVTVSASASAAATVVAQRILDGQASVSASASVSGSADRIRLDAASISADATVSSDAIRIRSGSASVSATATAIGLGGVEYQASASVYGYASATASPIAILDFRAVCTATGQVVCVGERLGENWTDETFGLNTWTDIHAGSNVWTQVPQGNNTWLRQG